MPAADEYLDILQHMVDSVADFFGDKVALKYARQAPLEIDPDGTIQQYYGDGEQAVSILLEHYEDYMGRSVADSRLRSAMQDLPRDRYDLLPDRIRPNHEDERSGFWERVRTMLGA